MEKRFKRTGFTLIELMMVVVILGVVIYFGAIGIKMIINLQTEGLSVQVQQEVQTALYFVSKDVRNSDLIIDVLQDTTGFVKLRSYNFSNGYDVGLIGSPNNNLFAGPNVSTITYRYLQTEAGSPTGSLERSVQWNGVIISSTVFLRDMLRPHPAPRGLPLFPDLPDNMFTILPTPLTPRPYPGLNVTLYVAPGGLLKEFPPRIFNIKQMIRGRLS